MIAKMDSGTRPNRSWYADRKSDNQEAAHKFLRFMLSPVAQQYFATQTFEYPLVEGVRTQRELPPLAELNAIQVDLANLADLEGTLALLRDVGALP